MSLRINYNLASLMAHHNLRSVDRLMIQSTERLSSGERIHRASDDPAAMVLSQKMRHHLAGLRQATNNSEEGVTMVQTAEGAMDTISQMLIRMRTLAVQAANTAVHDTNSLQALQNELNAAIENITRTANHTQFGKLKLLQGDLSTNTLSTTAQTVLSQVGHDMTHLPGGIQDNSTITTAVAAPLTLSRSRIDVTLTGLVSPLPGTTALQGLSQNGIALDDVANKTIAINGPLGSRTITLSASSTINDAVGLINAFTAQTGVRATYDANTGVLSAESSGFGNGTFSLDATDMTTLLNGNGLFDSDTTTVANAFLTPATNQTVQLNYVDAGGTARTMTLTQDPSADSDGLTFTNLAGGPELIAPFTAFEPGAFRVTFHDNSATTFGSNVSIAAGNYDATRVSTVFIQTGAEALQTTRLDIPDMRAAALGHSANFAAQNYADLEDLFTNDAFLNNQATLAIDLIDAAITEVTEARGRAGAIQANALEAGMANLRISVENISNADSRLRDTDFAAESAAYARHQIIYQAATAMLAQANQIPQTILQMLQNR
jgi:flagellin